MRKFVFIGVLVLTSCFILKSSPANAISFDFTGLITYSDNPIGAVGDSFSGTLTYDLSVADSNAWPVVGDYWYTSTPNGITININGAIFKTDPFNVSFLVETNNDYTGYGNGLVTDHFVVHSYNNINGAGIDWQLDDFTGTVLTSDSLPTYFNLSSWEQMFGLSISSYDGFMRGQVTSISTAAAPVPEPSTLILLVSGLAGLALTRKRVKI